MRSSRRLAAIAALFATALAGTPALVSSADAAPERSSDRAVARAADKYDVGEAALRARLIQDSSLRLSSSGLAYFVDPKVEIQRKRTSVEAAPFPLDQTFSLHSNRGSRRTIYLDFNGGNVSNTLWNGELGNDLPNGVHPPMELPGDGESAAAFSSFELEAIQSIWQRVSEDYAPFDVDVTTQDPGPAAIERTTSGDARYGTRALITNSTSAASTICNSQCGGVAFIGVFNHHAGKDDFPETHGQLQPAWVFPQLLSLDVKSIAEATTHEVGHNLGLDHDATSTQGYYEGHNGWAPIMGVAYKQPISQFARSDYPGAVLGGPVPPDPALQPNQDDIVTITTYGAVLRADEAAGDIAHAGAMPAGPAIIRNRTDQDYFSLGTCSGTVTVDADPAPVSPNLDIKLDLLGPDGSVVASADPSSASVSFDKASGLDASVTTSVPAGTYYVRVDGVGRGAANNGYTDYGSIGSYTLSSTGCVPEPPSEAKPGKARIGTAKPGSKGGKLTATVSWRPPVGTINPAINGWEAVAYKKNDKGKYVKVFSQVFPANTGGMKFTTSRRGSYKFSVRARNPLGYGAMSAQSNAVSPR